jgi:glycosyltransferase involved in cell wall biosynthesis
MIPKVSIVIPAYNVEKYIKRCIGSLQNQSLQEIEIIVVNDCSSDSTYSILQSIQRNDTRIKAYSNEKNMGPMWNRDFGAKKSIGKYVMFCDGDDTFPPYAVEHMYKAIEENKADMVTGNIDYISLDGSIRHSNNSLPYGDSWESTCKALLNWKYRHELCGKIFLTSLFTDYDYDIIPNFTNNEDEYMMYQLVGHIKKAGVLNESIYDYYQVQGSSTQKKFSDKAIENIFFVQSRKKVLFSNNPNLNKYVVRSIAYYILFIYCDPHHYNHQMLDELKKKYGLEDCLSYNTLRGVFSMKELCKIYFKLLLQSKLKLNISHLG